MLSEFCLTTFCETEHRTVTGATGVDCEHDELRGRCENVGSYSNFFPGGYWRNKEDGSWGGGWETGDPFKKANDDFDGHCFKKLITQYT